MFSCSDKESKEDGPQLSVPQRVAEQFPPEGLKIYLRLTQDALSPLFITASPPSQVKPPFHLCQKLDLVNVSIASTFSLPLIMPSLDRKESASLYLQVTPICVLLQISMGMSLSWGLPPVGLASWPSSCSGSSFRSPSLPVLHSAYCLSFWASQGMVTPIPFLSEAHMPSIILDSLPDRKSVV